MDSRGGGGGAGGDRKQGDRLPLWLEWASPRRRWPRMERGTGVTQNSESAYGVQSGVRPRAPGARPWGGGGRRSAVTGTLVAAPALLLPGCVTLGLWPQCSVPQSLPPDSGHNQRSASTRHSLAPRLSLERHGPLAQPPSSPWDTREGSRTPRAHTHCQWVGGFHSGLFARIPLLGLAHQVPHNQPGSPPCPQRLSSRSCSLGHGPPDSSLFPSGVRHGPASTPLPELVLSSPPGSSCSGVSPSRSSFKGPVL